MSITKTTRMEIAEFQTAFKRPLNQVLLENPSAEDRLLLGKLLIEEAIETVQKGLGLRLAVSNDHSYANDFIEGGIQFSIPDCDPGEQEPFTLTHIEGDMYDPIETADGLGDVNVVIHFISHWLGMNLDKVTSEIHRSNMSKLGADGKPIINGVTPGYRNDTLVDDKNEPGFDPSKPIGKILKGLNFTTPNLQPILAAGNWIDDSETA